MSGFTVVPGVVTVVGRVDVPKRPPVIENGTATADDGRVWDLEAGTRTDPDGTVVPEADWSEAEVDAVDNWRDVDAEQNHRAAIAASLDVVQDLRARAQEDADAVPALLTQAQAARQAWTARAVTIRAATPTLALLQEEAAKAAERDAQLMGAVAEVLVWRVKANNAIVTACYAVIRMGRIVARRLR